MTPAGVRWSVNSPSCPNKETDDRESAPGLSSGTGHRFTYLHFVICEAQNSLN